MASEVKDWEGWAILELFGHVRLAGYLSEATIAGGSFLRLDIPADGDPTARKVTQFFGASAVYRITPTTQEIARGVAMSSDPVPVQRWELPALQAKSVRICISCRQPFTPVSGDELRCVDCEASMEDEDDDEDEIDGRLDQIPY